MGDGMNAALDLQNLTLGYDRHPAVHHLSAGFEPGSLTAIVGPNGAGKSTLLKGIVGELKPRTGRIVGGGRRANIAYLPQIAEIDRSFPVTVESVVAMGLWREIGAFGAVRPAHRARIGEALRTVRLTGLERRPIGALSGGQMQRVLFARLVLQDAPLILLDEPFTAVDRRTVEDLLVVVEGWRAEGRTVLAVLHDIEEVRRHFPRTLLIARELIAHGETHHVLTAENLFRARTVSEAFDDSADVCRRAA
jgi:zinc/manganese transport system ATP-binding protein